MSLFKKSENMRYEAMTIRYKLLLFLFILKADWLLAEHFDTQALRGSINPNGIFFNRFTGSFSGTEWFQTTPIAGTNRYRMVDIFGGGFNATVTSDGMITLDGGVGAGSFSGPDDYVIMPNLGGTVFTFTCNRVPLTTENFPLLLESPRPANDLFAGTWDNVIESINPETGVIGAPGNEELILTTSANTLRITDPGGLFFQGIFENGRQIVFRKIEPNPTDPDLSSFPGSDINFSQNLMASVFFDNINRFTGLFLLQTRTPLGSQNQTMFRFTATRSVPLAMGDINADGLVNNVDRDLLVDQQGNTVESDAYNLAADLNRDNVVDNDDLIIFDSGEEIFSNGFE